MADSASLTKLESGVEKRLQDLTERSKSMRSFLNGTIYALYQQVQLNRWQTEGASETGQWASLSEGYAQRKKIMYGGGPKHKWIGGQGENRPWEVSGTWPSYPGAGTKVMIATGRLASSVIGPNPIWKGGERFHRKLVTDTSITIQVDSSQSKEGKDPGSEYFVYANQKREFMKFSQVTRDKFKQACRDFISKGKQS